MGREMVGYVIQSATCLTPELVLRFKSQLELQKIRLVCLGLGKCFHDRTAQVQTALLLLLMSDFQVSKRHDTKTPLTNSLHTW